MSSSPLLAVTAPAATVTLADRLVAEHYGDPLAEAAAVLAEGGLVDRSERGRLTVAGPDRAAWLNRLLTNDLAALRPGRGCRALLLTVKGKLAADLRVGALADRLWLDTAFDTGDSLLAFLRGRKLFGDRVELADARGDWVQLGVHGGAAAQLGLPELPLYGIDSWGDRVVLRHDELGLPGYDVFAPLAAGESLWREWAAQVRPFGWRAAELLRLEHGRPRWGAELTPDVFPAEAELEEALSHTKGCYLGQEFVARLRDRGHVNRCLRPLRVTGDVVPTRGAELTADGKPAGMVTSAVWSPRLGVVGLGYVRTAFAEPGARLSVGGATAVVGAWPG